MSEPAPGEVQVRLRAATLNYRAILLMRRGNTDGKLPYVPLSCACGDLVPQHIFSVTLSTRGRTAERIFSEGLQACRER